MRKLTRVFIGAGAIAAAALAVGLIRLSAPGTEVHGCPAGCAADPVRRPGPLRVMTLNVRQGFAGAGNRVERLEAIAEFVQRRDLDIVLLQEVARSAGGVSGAEYLGRRTGMNHAYARANGHLGLIGFEEGNAVLSRFPLRDVRVVALHPRAGFFENRIMLRAAAESPWGRINAVSVQLARDFTPAKPIQIKALQHFLKRHRAHALIVGGDFDTRESSVHVFLLSAVWRDAFRAAHPEAPGLTCCSRDADVPGDERFRRRSDYLFVRPADRGPGIGIAGAERVFVDPVYASGGPLRISDHAAVLAEVEFSE